MSIHKPSGLSILISKSILRAFTPRASIQEHPSCTRASLCYLMVVSNRAFLEHPPEHTNSKYVYSCHGCGLLLCSLFVCVGGSGDGPRVGCIMWLLLCWCLWLSLWHCCFWHLLLCVVCVGLCNVSETCVVVVARPSHSFTLA